MKKLDLIIQFIREFEEDDDDKQIDDLLNNLKYLSEKIENNKNVVEAKKDVYAVNKVKSSQARKYFSSAELPVSTMSRS